MTGETRLRRQEVRFTTAGCMDAAAVRTNWLAHPCIQL